MDGKDTIIRVNNLNKLKKLTRYSNSSTRCFFLYDSGNPWLVGVDVVILTCKAILRINEKVLH